MIPLNKKSSAAFNYIYFTSGEQTGTDDSGKETGKFRTSDQAFTISYSKLFNDNLAYGLNVKLIKSKLYNISKTFYAFDAGLQYQPLENLSFGFALKNFGQDIYYIDRNNNDRLPSSYNFGLSFSILKGILISADISKHVQDSSILFNTGSEITIMDNLRARTGYFDKGGGWKGFTYGAGFRTGNLFFDYANSPYGAHFRGSRYGIGFQIIK